MIYIVYYFISYVSLYYIKYACFMRISNLHYMHVHMFVSVVIVITGQLCSFILTTLQHSQVLTLGVF